MFKINLSRSHALIVNRNPFTSPRMRISLFCFVISDIKTSVSYIFLHKKLDTIYEVEEMSTISNDGPSIIKYYVCYFVTRCDRLVIEKRPLPESRSCIVFLCHKSVVSKSVRRVVYFHNQCNTVQTNPLKYVQERA